MNSNESNIINEDSMLFEKQLIMEECYNVNLSGVEIDSGRLSDSQSDDTKSNKKKNLDTCRI